MYIDSDKIKTYKDFKIGQSVWCKDIRGNEYDSLLDDHLTVGKEYIITDLEFKFPKSICITTDNNVEMFLRNYIFTDDIAYIREKTINEILKDG